MLVMIWTVKAHYFPHHIFKRILILLHREQFVTKLWKSQLVICFNGKQNLILGNFNSNTWRLDAIVYIYEEGMHVYI